MLNEAKHLNENTWYTFDAIDGNGNSRDNIYAYLDTRDPEIAYDLINNLLAKKNRNYSSSENYKSIQDLYNISNVRITNSKPSSTDIVLTDMMRQFRGVEATDLTLDTVKNDVKSVGINVGDDSKYFIHHRNHKEYDSTIDNISVIPYTDLVEANYVHDAIHALDYINGTPGTTTKATYNFIWYSNGVPVNKTLHIEII